MRAFLVVCHFGLSSASIVSRNRGSASSAEGGQYGRFRTSDAADYGVTFRSVQNRTRQGAKLCRHFVPGERVLRIALRIADGFFETAVDRLDGNMRGPFAREGLL